MKKFTLTLFTSIVMVAIGCTKEQDMPLDTVQQTNATKMTCGRVASDTVNTNKGRQASPYAVGNTSRLWPNKTVYIMYDKALPKFDKAIIMAAAKTIQEKTTVKFVERIDRNGYILVRRAAFAALSSSPIGYAPVEQTFETIPNITMGEAMHHLCHIIGLFDEHNRPQRDNRTLIILWQNIAIPSKFQINKGSDNGFLDIRSIMMHNSFYDTKNGQPTMIRFPDGDLLPYNKELSPTDIKVINDLYKKK